MPTTGEPGITVGTIGSGWRGTVTRWGALVPKDGSGVCDWWIGADDRVHVPAQEPSVRQRSIDGAPVVETVVRVPSGDAVQRVYAVADHGGLTVFEVENRSPLPFAIAVSRLDLLASRPPAAHPGIGVAPGVGQEDDETDGAGVAAAAWYPVAHRTTLRLALAHDGRGPGALPSPPPPSAAQVARGWRAIADRAGRIELPDADLGAEIVGARCALALYGLPDPDRDPGGFLLALAAGVGLSAPVPEVAAAAERLARRHRRARPASWDVLHALRAASIHLGRAGEHRAANDVLLAMARLGAADPAAPFPGSAAQAPGDPGPAGQALDPGSAGQALDPGPAGQALDPARWLAAMQARLVRPVTDGADLLPGVPPEWYGQSIEAHGLEVPAGTVSVAVRWHGARPALLWECSAPMRLTASTLDPAWSVYASRGGEALLRPTDG